jgi:DNA topoisomerase-2
VEGIIKIYERNGYGAKLANIFSKHFEIELCDGKQIYQQEWNNNMKECKNYKIFNCKKKEEYIKIRFLPDEKFFKNMDISEIILRRLYDISGCNPNLSVYFNEKKINIKSIKLLKNRF